MTRSFTAGVSLLMGLLALATAWTRLYAARTVPAETGEDMAVQLLNGELDALAHRLENLPGKPRPFASIAPAEATPTAAPDRLVILRERVSALEEITRLRCRIVPPGSYDFELADLLFSWYFYSRLAVTSTDPRVRAQALFRISELPSGTALLAPYVDNWVRDAYAEAPEVEVMLAASAWALPRDHRVRARLLEWLRTSPRPELRAYSLRGLEGHMDESLIGFVERAEQDASAAVRERARELTYRWHRKLHPKEDDD